MDSTHPQAMRLAERLVCRYPLSDSYHWRVLEAGAPVLVARAAALAEEETGLPAGSDPGVAVIDRLEWVQRNLTFFSTLMADREGSPRNLARSRSSSDPSGGFRGLEMGVLLGLLSNRVLGQYDLAIPSADSGDEICLSAPNILELERKHQLRPQEFRFWVALHEATHRLQFVGVPWLRSHFFELATDLVDMSGTEGSRLAAFTHGWRRVASEGLESLDDGGIPRLLATPAQRERLDRVQALMSLLEGHGHVVMDRIAARTLGSWRRLSALLTRRRDNPRVAALLRLTGLELKFRQYEDGRDFILYVEKRAGWSAVDLAWESPDALPTRSEIEDPETWLARVG